MKYPEARKEAVRNKMLPSDNKSAPRLAAKEGSPGALLYNQRKAARATRHRRVGLLSGAQYQSGLVYF
jgi:hypothetical protein